MDSTLALNAEDYKGSSPGSQGLGDDADAMSGGSGGVRETSAAGNSLDSTILEFNTYEDYLDSQITPVDLYYLEDKELARQLVELGYRGTGEPLKREDFEARKRTAKTLSMNQRLALRTVASQGKDLSGSPFLQALAEREEANLNGRLNTIIFMRTENAKGQEVSGYIDYAHRLKSENMMAYFDRQKPFIPKPSDLSFYNWETQVCANAASPNYQVISENETGVLFKNKRDRKIINVDPKLSSPGDSTVRTSLRTPEHVQVIFFDHSTRRKV